MIGAFEEVRALAGEAERAGLDGAAARAAVMDATVDALAGRLLDGRDAARRLGSSTARRLPGAIARRAATWAGEAEEARALVETLAAGADALFDGRSARGERAARGAFYTDGAEATLLVRLTVAEGIAARLPYASRALVRRAIVAPSATGDEALAAAGLWRDVARYAATATVLDPAAGAGAFLVAAARVLLDLARRAAHFLDGADARAGRPLADRLFGREVVPWVARLARLRLAVELGGALPPLLVADGLLAPRPRVDLVVGNPPYVRHEAIADPTGRLARDAYRAALAAVARRRLPHAPLDGKSDLAIHFFVAGLDALAPAGALGFVSSRGWLDASYGAPLRRLVAGPRRLALVVDSEAERSFAAAINTVLTIVTRPRPDEAAEPARFLALRRSLAAPDAPTLLARAIDEAERGRDEGDLGGDRTAGHGDDARSSLRTLPASALRAGADEPWGRHLRSLPVADALERAPLPRVPLGDRLRVGRGRRTGRDRFFCLTPARAEALGLSPRHLRPLVRSPGDFLATPPSTSRAPAASLLFLCERLDAPARAYVAGEERRTGAPAHRGTRPWWRLPIGAPPSLLVPIAVHDRLFLVENDAGHEAHQRFVTLDALDGGPLAPTAARAWAAWLSSTVVALAVEREGRRALGEGVLELPPEGWRRLRVPDLATLDGEAHAALAAAWSRIAEEPPRPVDEELTRPARRALDELVLQLMGASPRLAGPLAEELRAVVARRLAKARASR